MRAAALSGLAARGHEQAADPWATSTGFRVSNMGFFPPAAKDKSSRFFSQKSLDGICREHFAKTAKAPYRRVITVITVITPTLTNCMVDCDEYLP